MAHRLGRALRRDAGRVLVPVLLALAAGLTGLAAAGFLVASAYLALSAALGHGPATLLTGLGLAILALGFLALARNRLSRRNADDPPLTQPEQPAAGKSDLAARVAFTAAFVLARSLGKDKRG